MFAFNRKSCMLKKFILEFNFAKYKQRRKHNGCFNFNLPAFSCSIFQCQWFLNHNFQWFHFFSIKNTHYLNEITEMKSFKINQMKVCIILHKEKTLIIITIFSISSSKMIQNEENQKITGLVTLNIWGSRTYKLVIPDVKLDLFFLLFNFVFVMYIDTLSYIIMQQIHRFFF